MFFDFKYIKKFDLKIITIIVVNLFLIEINNYKYLIIKFN
jgi:hypothetical protein